MKTSLGKPGRARDGRALFFVRYADATSAGMRVPPEVAVFGAAQLSMVAAEKQAKGELPKGKITSILRVR